MAAVPKIPAPRQVLDAVGSPVVVADPDATVTYCNRAATRLFGWSAQEAVGQRLPALVRPSDPEDRDRLLAAMSGPTAWSGHVPLVRRDGAAFPAQVTVEPVRDEHDELVASVVTCLDLTEHQRVAAALEDREMLHLSILQTAQEGIWLVDDDGATVFANAKIADILGAPLEQIRASSSLDWVPAETRAEVNRRRAARKHRGHEVYELAFVRSGGERRWALISASPLFVRGTYRGSLVMMSDITERKRIELELEHRALHDALTGLANRAVLHDRLSQRLQERHRRGSVVVLFIDLDEFKQVNDRYGHAAGDEVLMQVAERLRGVVRAGDTLARLAGDEFVVVCRDVRDPVEAELLAERVLAAFAAPFTVNMMQLAVHASIGVAADTAGARDAEALLRDADAAMLQAKHRGRGRHVMFDRTVGRDAQLRLRQLDQLRRGVDRHQFVVHYQPEVDLETGAARAVEALLRWRHPRRGLRAPAEFLELAEASGLVVPIGRQVLADVCVQGARWAAALPAPLPVVVNVSGRELHDQALLAAVRAALNDSGLSPHLLRLEIGEATIIDDPEECARAMSALRTLGVRLSIDNVGAAWASPVYLVRLPVEEVKIDRQLVERVVDGGNAAPLVAALTSLAHALNLRVVAQGVETDAQERALRALGCDAAQGNRFQAADTAAATTTWLRGARLTSEPPADTR